MTLDTGALAMGAAARDAAAVLRDASAEIESMPPLEEELEAQTL